MKRNHIIGIRKWRKYFIENVGGYNRNNHHRPHQSENRGGAST